MNDFREKAEFIWSIAELLRHDYKRADYGKVILPFTVLRRFDCVLESTKQNVLSKLQELERTELKNVDPVLNKISGQAFHNKSKFDFRNLKADPNNIASNLRNYINGFSENARDIIEYFKFDEQISVLDDADLLYLVLEKFSEIDLHTDVINNEEMGYIFEELIRKFAEYSNETAGEHFTPREVIKLMVNLIYQEDAESLKKKGIVKTLYDPACGTGGMLSISEDYLKKINKEIRLEVFGQEVNKETYAVCKSEMMLKGQSASNIKFGNSFTQDGLKDEKFDYMLSNPPYGVAWKKYSKKIISEHEKLGFSGRFGAGLPRISDGQLLFLQHMISKMKKEGNGTRLAIVFNGSPLFTGDAGKCESEIRKWIIESDWLEAIVALPSQLFYNTGIFTYIWLLSNRKNKERKGKIQLINATEFFQKMRKNLGEKRNEITPSQIQKITEIHHEFQVGKHSKIFDNSYFAYRRITVERPLRLNFQVSDERMKILIENKSFLKLVKSKKRGDKKQEDIEKGRRLQKNIISSLKTIDSTIYKNRDEFIKEVETAFRKSNTELSKPILNLILSALSERDETAHVCIDAHKKPEPDPDLRDYENVPFNEDIHDYFDREVKPHYADAWIDEERTITGYEIPITHHFYKYVPLRSLDEIDSEVLKLENSIGQIMDDMTK